MIPFMFKGEKLYLKGSVYMDNTSCLMLLNSEGKSVGQASIHVGNGTQLGPSYIMVNNLHDKEGMRDALIAQEIAKPLKSLDYKSIVEIVHPQLLQDFWDSSEDLLAEYS